MELARLCRIVLVREELRFLELNGERIFTAHHFPEQTPARAVVMCHPLAEEKLWSHRVFVSFARELAHAGFAVARFDFRGEGDSDREFQHSDLESRVEDTGFAIDTLRRLHPTIAEISLLGLRLGASVAAVTASRRSDVARLLLWDPVTDGSSYMQSVLRLNLMFQMALHRKVIESRDALAERLTRGETVNIEGYDLSEPLFLQVSRFRLQDTLAAFHGDTLLVQVNQDDNLIRPDLQALADARKQCHVVAVQEQAFWKEIRAFYQRAPELTKVTLKALGVAQ